MLRYSLPRQHRFYRCLEIYLVFFSLLFFSGMKQESTGSALTAIAFLPRFWLDFPSSSSSVLFLFVFSVVVVFSIVRRWFRSGTTRLFLFLFYSLCWRIVFWCGLCLCCMPCQLSTEFWLFVGVLPAHTFDGVSFSFFSWPCCKNQLARSSQEKTPLTECHRRRPNEPKEKPEKI